MIKGKNFINDKQQYFRRLNQNRKDISKVDTVYVNEYGDVIAPNDPILQKYQNLIDKFHEPDYQQSTMEDVMAEFIMKFKAKRQQEEQLKEQQRIKQQNKDKNTIMDAFKMLCGIKSN